MNFKVPPRLKKPIKRKWGENPHMMLTILFPTQRLQRVRDILYNLDLIWQSQSSVVSQHICFHREHPCLKQMGPLLSVEFHLMENYHWLAREGNLVPAETQPDIAVRLISLIIIISISPCRTHTYAQHWSPPPSQYGCHCMQFVVITSHTLKTLYPSHEQLQDQRHTIQRRVVKLPNRHASVFKKILKTRYLVH